MAAICHVVGHVVLVVVIESKPDVQSSDIRREKRPADNFRVGVMSVQLDFLFVILECSCMVHGYKRFKFFEEYFEHYYVV